MIYRNGDASILSRAVAEKHPLPFRCGSWLIPLIRIFMSSSYIYDSVCFLLLDSVNVFYKWLAALAALGEYDGILAIEKAAPIYLC